MSEPFPWSEGCAGAVSLTFDDAIASHLTRVAPMLNARSLLGTFYVNPNPNWMANAAAWRAVQQAGHEIGNHTVQHPCSRNYPWNRETRGLEDMTLAEIEEDVRAGRETIEAAIPEQGAQSFCYPCYQDYVGRGESRQSYVPIVAKYHIAARGRGETPNDPRIIDLHYVWSHQCERLSGAALVGLCEWAAADGGWGVLTFHGVGDAHLLVGESDFLTLCDYLASQHDRLWTAPFARVAEHILAWRQQTREKERSA